MIIARKVFGPQVGTFEKIRGKKSFNWGDPSVLYKEPRVSPKREGFKQKFELSVERQNRADMGSKKDRSGSNRQSKGEGVKWTPTLQDSPRTQGQAPSLHSPSHSCRKPLQVSSQSVLLLVSDSSSQSFLPLALGTFPTLRYL